MALLNLWYVTHSLTTLIKAAVEASPAYGNPTVTVSARSPDQIKGNSNTLGFYLYHIAEDSHYKNLPAPGGESPPVRFTPMGLNLYYQLTAHGDDTEAGIEQAQLIMGLAVKALRDYPVIDESTEVVNTKQHPVKKTKILDDHLKASGARFKIALQPLPHNEAVSFWTAGSSPLMVAAYYQVYVALLEPEEPQRRTGRVLTYGTYTEISGAPHLDGTHNEIMFTDPRGFQNKIELRPAQAPPAVAAVKPVPTESQVVFEGANLVGDKTVLVLKNSLWKEPVEVQDPAWLVLAANSQVKAVIREDVSGKSGVKKKLLPGIYAAMVKVTKVRELPDGSQRDFAYTSNETPFVVTPRIKVSGPYAQNVFKVEGFIFKYEVKDPITQQLRNVVSIQVYVANVQLKAGVAANLSEGEFGIHEPPAPQSPELHFRLPIKEELPDPIKIGSDEYFPFRLFVNGAESSPIWIKI